MTIRYTRRQAVKTLAAASAATLLPRIAKSEAEQLMVAGRPVELQLTSVSENCARISLIPIENGVTAAAVPDDGSLVRTDWGNPVAALRSTTQRSMKCGDLDVKIKFDPLTIAISGRDRKPIQHIVVDEKSVEVSFNTGDAPLFGMGEGGPQFDRRGSVEKMKSGQGGYELATHGGRVPIPWVISASVWAMFVHRPYGSFDLTGPISKFHPFSGEAALPLDIFFIASSEPAVIMSEFARLTGLAELPPLWSLGYQQSHRTLTSRDEVLAEAKTFREKKLPCDALIYLGTGFCPSGWNVANGSFEWNAKIFPDPKEMIEQFHAENFKIVLHAVIETDTLNGSVRDRVHCNADSAKSEEASCYWDAHRKDFAMGVDGWWPDEGDPLDIPSRLVRNRMYWEGPQIDRPNERPYALHRNGYAGMQRYASFLWSGDVYSTWKTLKTHIPIAINTGLSGIPYWGTDIGGFVPTKEFTAELYVRWFQFGAFCTLFRCHGRNWKLRLPWGWDTGDAGPNEIGHYEGAVLPDPSQLRNPQVEPICRKYLELRYQMLPYIYSAVRECTKTGMPIMRGLWLHYPEDPKAVERYDEYLWGRDLLVAPVVEQGASSRSVYLPRGVWYDFWTNERVEGGREIARPVDLETIPLYVRGGAILPLGPVQQYVHEKSDEPLKVNIYPGEDGKFLLYEDDGASFDYRRGEWMGIEMQWNDAARSFEAHLAKGSKVLAPLRRQIEINIDGQHRRVEFNGKPLEIRF